MKIRNIAIVAVAAMLLVTTAISTSALPNNVFAYKKNQATSQANACGNDFIPINVGCQSTDSQIQGDENGAALTAQQTFPEVEREMKDRPEPPPKTATLNVVKEVICPDSFEDVCPAPSEFTFDVAYGDPITVISFPASMGERIFLDSGSYEVTEPGAPPAPSGLIALDPVFSPDCSGDIQAGQELTCTVTNEFVLPQTCIECFTTDLDDEQITVFLSLTSFEDLEELCEYLESATPQQQRFNVRIFGDFLKLGVPSIGVDPITDGPTADRIKECLERIIGLQT
jgi:hypothetical protein